MRLCPEQVPQGQASMQCTRLASKPPESCKRPTLARRIFDSLRLTALDAMQQLPKEGVICQRQPFCYADWQSGCVRMSLSAS